MKLEEYDVLIVGGRPAGATLAARLGARGHTVLLLERATFPSLPAVPSSPILYAVSMDLLEQLGIPEESYAAAVTPIRGLLLAMGEHFDASLPVPPMWGRSYIYGLDRHRFDEVLWRNVARFPSVTRREDFNVTDLVRDDAGRVGGVVGRARGGDEERFHARCVVGADGRFSLVARKAGARVVEEETKCLSTVYYADWEGITSFGEGPDVAYIHATLRGLDVLFVPMPGGRVSLNIHVRADRAVVDGDAQRYYLGVLQSVPAAARRIQGARQVNEVVGIKRIGNGYRETSGPGWVLVGDAVHYKDPVDGQGIYDALVEARALDRALASFLAGHRGWDAAMRAYHQDLHRETHGMYLETVGRLRRELYQEPPPLVAKTLLRWLVNDPVYKDRFLKFLGRAIPPEGWLSPELVLGAAARGISQDLRGLVSGRAAVARTT